MSSNPKSRQSVIGDAAHPKAPSRQEQLRKLLSRKSGITVAQLQKTFGWQPHTVRAAISRQRKSGFVIARTASEKGSVYRLVPQAADQ